LASTDVFIDSNVLANWMILDGAVQKAKENPKRLHEIQERAGRKWPSYQLLEELRRIGNRPSFTSLFKFGTSAFAMAETSHVILKEYVASRLQRKGIPPAQWESLSKQRHFSDEDRRDLISQLKRLQEVFFKPHSRILYQMDETDFLVASDLVTLFRLSTTDAFLVSQAAKRECDYFLTEDKPLRHLLPKYRRGMIWMRMISAQEMLAQIKQALRYLDAEDLNHSL
jgi:predicted nucleic acid-binding protein